MTLRGRRIGDRRLRVERTRPQSYEVRPPKRVRRPPSPWIVLIVTFAMLTIVGTVLLALPIATEQGQRTGILEALFTATSAVSTTGLVIADTASHWSSFGELVILLLIQLGGFAFMTGSTLFLFLLAGRRTSLSDRLRVQAAGGATDLGSVLDLVRRVVAFTLICEILGAAVLTVVFATRGESAATSVWWGVFHTVSAFNNAGFDLFGELRSLTHLADAPAVLVPLGALIVLGGLGFAIVGDVIAKRRWVRLSLESKLVLLGTAVLLLGGAVATAALEWANPATLGRLEPLDRLVNAAFHSVSLRSAGFDSVAIGGLFDETLVVGIVLMFIGGASGSTAGGIKLNTLAVLVVASMSAVRGDPSASAFGRRLPHVVVYRSVAILLVALTGAIGLALALRLAVPGDLLDLTFEGISALGTVGVSTGITTGLGPAGQVLLVVAMFVGRLGPLALVLALAARTRPVAHRPAVETIRIG
ncbi:MAG: Trk family potassium uptake protein [Chloroflexi bacterium]|nr:Trk family potassium uptake protein [Chloroflexota bacterium]